MRSRHAHAVEVAAAAFSLLAPNASGGGRPHSHAVRTSPRSRPRSDPQRGVAGIVEMMPGGLERVRRALMAVSDHLLLLGSRT
jgi:hypothetical protein